MSNKKKQYNAALIIIGDEILFGTTRDTNTPFIAEALTTKGIRLLEVRVVPDIKENIVHAVQDLKDNYDYVFTTGGIGPTHDDITTESIASAFNIEVEENLEARKLLENYYGAENLNTSRLKMAQLPKGAKLIENPISATPGFIVENIYVMAGIPRIMQVMFHNIIDTLAGGNPMLSNTIACDLYESQIANELSQLQDSYDNVSIGSYPQYRSGQLGLSIAIRSTDKKILDIVTDTVIKSIEKLGGTSKAINVRTDLQKTI